jgi:hypothetical protein
VKGIVDVLGQFDADAIHPGDVFDTGTGQLL